MLILSIRTDKPDAEIGLFEDDKQVAYLQWYAHRELSVTLHQKILVMLEEQNRQLSDIAGIVVFKGPGSFTGLRIGLTVANAFADSLGVPIIGEAQNGDDSQDADGGSGYAGWLRRALKRATAGENEQVVLPEYGAPPHITAPNK